jgi:MoaA/NifB/PqqE/SkfB family radical SAM enzyme
MRLTTRLQRVARIARNGFWAIADRYRPVLVHIVPMRRCNLACAYCNEYDAVSRPVPLETMRARVDRLADLGTIIMTLSGGEPLLHPDLDAIVAAGRRRWMFVTLITNGYYLSPERIRRLNRAGLDHLQISIDNVEPDEVSKKSLRLLGPKLRWLADYADFTITINSVVGSGVRNPEDAIAVCRRARELGFMTSLGIVHDGNGQLRPLGPRERAVYEELKRIGQRKSVLRFNPRFQDNLARGLPNDWSCRAGARYLYVDEDGLVSYCSQQRGYPGVPLERYTLDDVRREYETSKPCAPYCTVNCVQQVGVWDRWRAPQRQVARVGHRPPVGPAPGPAAAPASGE